MTRRNGFRQAGDGVFVNRRKLGHLITEAVSLGKLGAPEAVEPLIQAMGDESELVRKAAVNGLGMIGDKRALTALEKAAGDTEAVAERAQAVIQKIEADAAPWWRKMWQK